MQNIIINTDDFGISKGVNYAVIQANKEGVVNSTTALVCAPEIDHAVELAQKNPKLNIGIHLTIDCFECLSKDAQLCNNDGIFYKNAEKSNLRELDESLLLREWELQISRFKNLFGKLPDHLDSHHNVHPNNETCCKVVKQLSDKYQIPVRGLTLGIANSSVNTDFYGEQVSLDNLMGIIADFEDKEVTNKEIMIHNGYLDKALENTTTYSYDRIIEHEILTSDKFKEYLKNNKINIVGFKVKEKNG
ncbi:MAG: ChbG/HpnK family deacetylase [Erysipelotrichaceae bacterium]